MWVVFDLLGCRLYVLFQLVLSLTRVLDNNIYLKMYNVFDLSASKMCRITLTTPSNRRNDEKTRSGCNPIILRTKDIMKNYKSKQMSSFVPCHPYLIVKLKSRSRAGKSQVKVRKGLGRSELSQGQVFHFPPTITTTTTTQVWLEEVIF